ncbi:hypothetical protein Patl1_17451 [Pistacia atlantica]|uniref:Uncharacterized protein n=1 Tax=Pistacia atlantica TaxID=434234 RepID=A0ACC1C3F3_9ROSI|nr:hypothetical protein Patl1_17451 [Pistacia atlantica]
MGRAPCCSKVGLRTGPWSATEDTLLTNYIRKQKSNNDDNDSSNTANEEITKTKIYLPKAVKVSPYSFAIRSTGFDNMGSGSSSPSDGEKNIIRSNDTNPVAWWPDLVEEKATNSEVGGSCRNGEPSLANYGSDFSFLDFVPIEGNMLDEIIGEYQQLLNFEEDVQLDSFEDLLSV